jgi:aspartate aminotransferase
VGFGREAEELTGRLAYVDFDGSRALVASMGCSAAHQLDETFLRSYCHPVMEAVDRLCDWLTG